MKKFNPTVGAKTSTLSKVATTGKYVSPSRKSFNNLVKERQKKAGLKTISTMSKGSSRRGAISYKRRGNPGSKMHTSDTQLDLSAMSRKF